MPGASDRNGCPCTFLYEFMNWESLVKRDSWGSLKSFSETTARAETHKHKMHTSAEPRLFKGLKHQIARVIKYLTAHHRRIAHHKWMAHYSFNFVLMFCLAVRWPWKGMCRWMNARAYCTASERIDVCVYKSQEQKWESARSATLLWRCGSNLHCWPIAHLFSTPAASGSATQEIFARGNIWG